MVFGNSQYIFGGFSDSCLRRPGFKMEEKIVSSPVNGVSQWVLAYAALAM